MAQAHSEQSANNTPPAEEKVLSLSDLRLARHRAAQEKYISKNPKKGSRVHVTVATFEMLELYGMYCGLKDNRVSAATQGLVNFVTHKLFREWVHGLIRSRTHVVKTVGRPETPRSKLEEGLRSIFSKHRHGLSQPVLKGLVDYFEGHRVVEPEFRSTKELWIPIKIAEQLVPIAAKFAEKGSCGYIATLGPKLSLGRLCDCLVSTYVYREEFSRAKKASAHPGFAAKVRDVDVPTAAMAEKLSA